jgi:hypothetical protein
MTVSERVAELSAALREPLNRLREAGSIAVPPDELLESALAGCLSSRGATWRKTRPKGDDAAETLWALVKFHRSGGSLYGWPWFAPKELCDQMDTVAQVLLIVSGQPLSAVNAWQRAMS